MDQRKFHATVVQLDAPHQHGLRMEKTMETYRDHPLAFLCGRTSPRTLEARASDWRRKSHDAMGIDVAGIFDRAAGNIRMMRASLSDLLDMTRAGADIDAIADAGRRMEVDFAVAAEALETAQFMRDRMLDPYGGSVCASLEMAYEELCLIGQSVESIIVLADGSESYDGIEAVILDAMDMAEKPAVTHEAPRGLM